MICVDASVVVKWLFDEEHSAEARALLRSAAEAKEQIIAPPLVISEGTNAIRQAQRRGELDLERARSVLKELLTFPIAILSPDDLLDRALMTAHMHNLPAIYDAQYVALSEMTGADLWTADKRLLRSLGGLSFVHDIADWRPPAETA